MNADLSKMQSGFYVWGGEWDREFNGIKENTFVINGPFKIYKEAYNEWRRLSWAFVDNCFYRFIIQEQKTETR